MMKSVIQLCAILALAGCAEDLVEDLVGDFDDYTPLSLTPMGDHFLAAGEIDDTTPDMLREAFEARPEVKKIVLQFVPGSLDDEANLEASRLIRARGMTTVVPAGGLVASGGTDMFLAGRTREIASGSCVGVHSWATDDGVEGKDVPRSDPEHRLYLSYYDEMGISPDFYWFTLEAADAEDMHYMSNAEITRYGAATRSVAGNEEVRAARCREIADRY